MTYFEKLQDPRWQKKRLEIMSRDNWTCQKCGCTDQQLQVHHKYYVWNNEPWEYPLEALITLCKSCHEDESIFKKAFQELLQELLHDGYTYAHLNQYLSGLQKPMDLDKGERAILGSFLTSQPEHLQAAAKEIDAAWDWFFDDLEAQKRAANKGQ